MEMAKAIAKLRSRESRNGGGRKREEGVSGGAVHFAREPVSGFDGYLYEEGEGPLSFHVHSDSEESHIRRCR